MSVDIREIQETYNVVPVKCLAHSLQLVIKARLFKDDKVKEMITKARSIIGHFSHSTSSKKVLKEMQDTQYCQPCLNTGYIYTLGLDTTGIEAFARTTSCSASLSTSYNLQQNLQLKNG
ncbi:hypothetical protein EVAR_45771_1 [Eumeta japonica]|uniref:Zinc finger BED domain-containing protein 4 n=1 Tax=Eumeta variegata TaxID=151549 RepID=A0A4C1YXL6_EUMVA|nr:hypothetical protein EVAR_45771_1 [Eumeta japonica]